MSFKFIVMGALLSLISPITAASDFSLRESDYKNFPHSLNGRDFFIKHSASTRKAESNLFHMFSMENREENCRNKIAKVVCLVDPSQEGQDPEKRPCLDGSLTYASAFENLHDNYPPVLQRMFCSLRHIFIEKEFFGTAYAGTFKDENGKINGAMIGIKKSVIDENLNLTTWASWKEQLSFGGIADSYTITPDLPAIETHSQTNANDFLYFVIAHEFGHILDFANDLNKVKNCTEPKDKNEDPECEMHEDSWGAFSWITDQKPKPENEFSDRKSLCFYWCNGSTLQKDNVRRIYADMANTSFISIYATTQPWDDFADSLAYFIMRKNLSTRYLIDSRQGQIYDIVDKLTSTLFAKKFEYLDSFLKRSDLVYP